MGMSLDLGEVAHVDQGTAACRATLFLSLSLFVSVTTTGIAAFH
jgi:hypothetical protein